MDYPKMLYKGGLASDSPSDYRVAADEEEEKLLKAEGFERLKPLKKVFDKLSQTFVVKAEKGA